jgi:CheY-like chemotaxis protein
MVHGLTAQLGGGFRISSALGEGTRVELYLPIADSNKVSISRYPIEAVADSDRVHSVLLVDDEEIVRVATAEMIRDLGHDVTEAASGSQALEMLANGLEVDVLITDYKMPRIDGAELARQVRQLQPSIAVLLITGYTGATKEIGNLPRLDKPFGQAEIRAALADLFANEDNVLPFRGSDRSA